MNQDTRNIVLDCFRDNPDVLVLGVGQPRPVPTVDWKNLLWCRCDGGFLGCRCRDFSTRTDKELGNTHQDVTSLVGCCEEGRWVHHQRETGLQGNECIIERPKI